MKSTQIFAWAVLVFVGVGLLPACQSPEIEQSEPEPLEDPPSGTLFQTEALEPKPDTSFYDAVSKATAAADQTQTAKTANDWQAVVDLWQEALELMNSVPRSSESHSLAQQRVGEYQKNQEYALTQQQKLQGIEAQE